MSPFQWGLGAVAVLAVVVGGGMMATRSRRFLGLAWLAVGAALLLVTMNPALFGGPEADSQAMRMRLVLGALSVLVLLITLEAVRRYAMQERYALLWVATGLILVAFAIYPDAVAWLAALTGMQYTSAITIVVFAFLLLIAFEFSLELSRGRDDRKRLSQHAAALELRVAELERQIAGKPPSEKPS